MASKTRLRLVGIALCILLSGCTPPVPARIPPPQTPAALVQVRTPAPASTRKPAETSTLSRQPSPRVTSSATVMPSATLPPTPASTLDTLRRTPSTLMLHRSSPEFDSVQFLEGFLKILKEHGSQVTTYQDISRDPDSTALQQGKLFIITIDDISLQAEIHSSIQTMISMLLDAGYPAVLGIVTTGPFANENTVKTLKTLAGQGWELAMHTDTHTNLQELEQVSPYGARLEIRTCSDKIFKYTGVRPITLVLPYGAMVMDLKILYREKVVWTVGINGGEKYRTTNYTYYVGREGPDGDPEMTYNILMKRFNGIDLPG